MVSGHSSVIPSRPFWGLLLLLGAASIFGAAASAQPQASADASSTKPIEKPVEKPIEKPTQSPVIVYPSSLKRWFSERWQVITGDKQPLFQKKFELPDPEDTLVSAGVLPVSKSMPGSLAGGREILMGSARGSVIHLKLNPDRPAEDDYYWQRLKGEGTSIATPIQALAPAEQATEKQAAEKQATEQAGQWWIARGALLSTWTRGQGILSNEYVGSASIQAVVPAEGQVVTGSAEGMTCRETASGTLKLTSTTLQNVKNRSILRPGRIRSIVWANDRFLIGSRDQGLFEQTNPQGCVLRPTKVQWYQESDITVLKFDPSRKMLLIGGAQGQLMRVQFASADAEDHKVTRMWQSPFEEPYPLVTRIEIDPETGELWLVVGTRLVHLGDDGNLLNVFTEADGIDPQSLQALLLDVERGQIWVGNRAAYLSQIRLSTASAWPLRVVLLGFGLLLTVMWFALLKNLFGRRRGIEHLTV